MGSVLYGLMHDDGGCGGACLKYLGYYCGAGHLFGLTERIEKISKNIDFIIRKAYNTLSAYLSCDSDMYFSN